MHSRKNIRRRKLARRVESSIQSHTPTVAEGLVDYFTPFVPEGQTLPDFAALLELQAWVLNHHRIDFQAKDRAHEKELGNDKELRRVRDASAQALHTKMGEMTKTIDGAYGEGRCQEILGFGEGLRPEPEQMLELSEQGLERLSAPGFTLPAAKLGGVELKIDDLLQQLADPHDDLAAAITALDTEKDKFDATVTAKQSSEKELNSVTVRHSRLVEELYRIGGHSDLADRLRPPTHRSKSFRKDEAAAAAGSDTTDGATDGDASTDGDSTDGDSTDGDSTDGDSTDGTGGQATAADAASSDDTSSDDTSSDDPAQGSETASDSASIPAANRQTEPTATSP